ncbi:MAG: DUF342 domain-containing protein [Chitinophagales bacterium]
MSSNSALKSNHKPETRISIRITPDKMQAYITLNLRPQESVTVDELYSELKKCGVVFGIDPVKLASLQGATRSELIATGIWPKTGSDAKITYLFQKPSIKPTITKDGKINHYDLGQIIVVEEGQLLATKSPAGDGEPGRNVLGELISAVPGKNKEFQVGKGVCIVNNHAIAQYEGALSWKGSKVLVDRVFLVPSDVDSSIGNINFPGKVLILGNVNEKFSVEADDDIEIRGGIDGARVISRRGSVIVKGGVRGQTKTLIKARRNIGARFIEEAIVEAGQDIVVNEYIIRSSIKGLSVFVQGVNGKILGDNQIVAKTKVKINTINSDDDSIDIRVQGIDRSLCYNRLRDINRSLQYMNKQSITLASKSQRLSGLRDEKSTAELRSAIKEYMVLNSVVDQLKEEQQDLLALLKSLLGEGMIEIKGLVNTGHSFIIKQHTVSIQEPLNNITIYYDEQAQRIILKHNDGLK